MPSQFRDPKTLPEWIELDYYRRPRPLRLVRRRVTWAVLFVFVALLAGAYWLGNRLIYQAGPLAAAHSMFNNDCQLCHTEAFRTAQRLSPLHAALTAVPDDACQRCHQGGPHNDQQAAVPHCAGCHREHRGRESLARMSDGHCTHCHGDLRRQDGSPSAFANVTSFAHDHPEFRQRQDPGVLAFNHQVHLKAGGTLGPGGKTMTLECVACHQPDAAYRYMKPINYEGHCALCHPLAVPLGDSWSDAQTREAAEQFRRHPAPHKEPSTVRAALRERYTDFLRQHGTKHETADDSARPLPDRAAPQTEVDRERLWVNRQLLDAERVLFAGAGGCRYCHAGQTEWTPGRLPEYVRPKLPGRWLVHSVFSHDSHRLLACTECHAGVSRSKATADVLLPRLATCQACHQPQVGARSDCVECHRYHDRGQERHHQGRLTIQELLRTGK